MHRSAWPREPGSQSVLRFQKATPSDGVGPRVKPPCPSLSQIVHWVGVWKHDVTRSMSPSSSTSANRKRTGPLAQTSLLSAIPDRSSCLTREPVESPRKIGGDDVLLREPVRTPDELANAADGLSPVAVSRKRMRGASTTCRMRINGISLSAN
jgi:hypothetical protein